MNLDDIELDLEYLRTRHLYLCTPCYGGQITAATFSSYMEWSAVAAKYGIPWTFETLLNESLVTRARNTMVAKFLVEQPQATDLVFIDADIGWSPWQLMALVGHRKPLVGGLYPLKTLPLQWVVNGIDGAVQDSNGLLEVAKTGTGFLAIDRDVFKVLDGHPDVKSFRNDIGHDTALDAGMRTYFDTAVRDGRYMSEDWEFCERYRDLGGKVYVDTRIQLTHTGTLTFCSEQDQKLRSLYRAPGAEG